MERRQEHEPSPVRDTIAQEGLSRKDAAVQHPLQRPVVSPVALSEARRRRALSRTLTQVSADVPVVASDDRGRGGLRIARAQATQAVERTRLLRDALDYLGREALAALVAMWRPPRHPAPDPEAAHISGEHIVDALTPTTRMLLRWWFADAARDARPADFHHGQRQALLRTVLACEWLDADDPDTLYRRACSLDAAPSTMPPMSTTGIDRPWTCRLHFAAGTGGGRVLFALWLWQWLNHRADPASRRFHARTVLRIGDASRVAAWRDRWFGPVATTGRRDPARTGWWRDLRLLLPPRLRGTLTALFRDGTMDDADAPLRIEHAPDLAVDQLSLQLWSKDDAVDAAPRLRFDLSTTMPDPTAAGASDDTACIAQTAPLSLAEYRCTDAVHDGIAKPVLLLSPAGTSPADRRRPKGRSSPRPALRRQHHRQLAEGLAELQRRNRVAAATSRLSTPHLQTPHPPTSRLLVLCADARHPRAVLRALRARGMPRDAVSMPADPVDERTLVLVRTAACRIAPDPGIGVLVPLRDPCAPAAVFDDPARLLAPALPSAWPTPEQATARHRLRERLAAGRMPADRNAFLAVIEHPADHDAYAAWIAARAAIRPPVAAHATASPTLATDGAPAWPTMPASPSSWILDLPTGMTEDIVRAWFDDGSGLMSAFVACAAADPLVASLRPLDPRRDAAALRDALLARGRPTAPWPRAIVRTARHVHVVAFTGGVPSNDRARAGAQCPDVDRLRRTLARLCRRASLRMHEGTHAPSPWRYVEVPIPRFWSWKRQGIPLSTLLLALPDLAEAADTRRDVAMLDGTIDASARAAHSVRHPH